MATTHDAIIIGTGQACPLAQRLAASGMKVAIIERKSFGGTCVDTGCISTKNTVASAYAAHMVSRAAPFGVFEDAIHRYSTSYAHSPDDLRAEPDDAWRTPATRPDKPRARSVVHDE